MIRNIYSKIVLFLLLSMSLATAQDEVVADSGDTAWMLTSTVLVLLMTLPGLAFFYGGLVRSKNILSVLVQCFAIAGIMSLLWIVVGYAIAAGGGDSMYYGWNPDFVGLGHLTEASLSGTIPESVFITFQMTFIIISPAIIIGAFAERMKFSAVLIFTVIWTILSYLPMWHMVWNGGLFHGGDDGNWLMNAGEHAIDFAGGNVVHINAGIAGLVACIFVGRRRGYPGPSLAPHQVPFVVLGAALLWVGWFGFNAGSAVSASGGAGMAMLTTQAAAATAVVAWMLLEWIVSKKPTAVGVATGAVAGLVGITPAAGSTTVMGAIAIGGITSVVCFFAATKLKRVFGFDDSLDVFGVHGVGGIIGALLTGYFVREGVEGGMGQVFVQFKSIVVTILWSAVASVIALLVAKVTVGLRVDDDTENIGLDLKEHGEEAYNTEN